MKKTNDLEVISDYFAKKTNASYDYFPQDDDYWNFYRNISGVLNEEYFLVYFRQKDNNVEIEISSTTDCKEEVYNILCKITDLKIIVE